MSTLRRILIVVLALSAVFVVARIHSISKEAQALKFDLAEIDDVAYGLLDANIWVDHLLVVLDTQIESFGEAPDQRESVQIAIENVINQLITEVERTIRQQNEERPFGSLRQLATDFMVDFDELRENSDTYAAIAVEELERPENQDRLKAYVRERVIEFSNSTFSEVDRTLYDATLARYDCADRDACRPEITARVEERNQTLLGLTMTAIGLVAGVIVLASVGGGPSLGIVTLSALLIGVFALLLGGLLMPMIDIEAEIQRLDLVIVGESITFENQVLFFQSKSILDVVDLLVRTGRFDLILVGIGIGLFSVVFPVAKLGATFAYRLSERWRESRVVRFFALESAKWSMADVFVIAMFLAFLGFDGLTGSQLAALVAESQVVDVETVNGTRLGVGFYLFAAFCLSGLIVSTLVKRSTARRTA